MKISTLLAALLAMTVIAACNEAPSDPQTIRETGYLTCQDGGDECDGFLCSGEDDQTECIDAPDDCTELTCECIGELVCGERECSTNEESNVVCVTPEYDPCEGKECGDLCGVCPPDDEECVETGQLTACDPDGQCVADNANLCDEDYDPCADKDCGDSCTLCPPEDPDCQQGPVQPRLCNLDAECVPEVQVQPGSCVGEMVCDDNEELSCRQEEICCADRCCGGSQVCCTGIPLPDGEGLCVDEGDPCPESRRSVKKNINYITTQDADRLSEQLRDIRLATYHYKTQPSSDPLHLGFIIEDQPGPHTVAADGRHVDLYGYTSLAVATLQVQDRKIQVLETELKVLRLEILKLKNQRSVTSAR